MNVFLLIVLIFCIEQSESETCRDFKTCGACLGSPTERCMWCSSPKSDVKQRCQPEGFNKQKGNKNWCKGFTYSPNLTYFNNVDKPFGSAHGDKPAVQFRPQKIEVKLRPGADLKFPMYFKHAEHFPLDVYYLMDYSYTMNKFVSTLQSQSEIVKRELTMFTNNVWFGLGSFIEKPDYPFAGTQHRTYAFRNNLNLTSDINLFSRVLGEDRNFSNYDLPEAGLDALMQVMACDKKLGWRPNAKRIIVLCTDATYHSAGDGKAVLAYKPNDMKCHLNSTNYYENSLTHDYPSVSQINKMARDGKFKIIFATLSEAEKIYTTLQPHIYEAKVAVLTENSIIQIIKEAYLESIRYVKIKYQFPPFVTLKMEPDCTRAGTLACRVGHKEMFTINATLRVAYCPSDVSDYHQILEVGPVDGGIEDKLKIDLKIFNCQCECEIIPKSPRCSNAGTLECGVCLCNKDRYGDACECDGASTNKTYLEKCKNINDTRYCSGKGSCDGCGKCTCRNGFSGDFCEFDDNSCKKKDNRLCSGNGRCYRGACECSNEYWTGEDCGCSKLKDNCFAPYSREVCSGKGECICNECVCEKVEGKTETYSGVFCEDCEECAEKRCKDLEGYVRCNFMLNKTYCDEEFNQTTNTELQFLNKSEINARSWPTTAKWCKAKLSNKKSIVFIHMYDKFDKKLRLIIQTEEDEEPQPNIWIPVGIAIGTVILIGLLTVLVWKLLVDAMDKREYNKFMNQAKSEGYDVHNPIYQPASVNFSNPMYTENTLVQNR